MHNFSENFRKNLMLQNRNLDSLVLRDEQILGQESGKRGQNLGHNVGKPRQKLGQNSDSVNFKEGKRVLPKTCPKCCPKSCRALPKSCPK